MDAELTKMITRINKNLNVEMTAENMRGQPGKYRILVRGSLAYSGDLADVLTFLDGYWDRSHPMTVQVTEEIKAQIGRLLKKFRYVVADYNGIYGTGDREVRHEGTLFNQRIFSHYQRDGWPREL